MRSGSDFAFNYPSTLIYFEKKKLKKLFHFMLFPFERLLQSGLKISSLGTSRTIYKL